LADLIQSISHASKQQARSSESLSKAMSEIAAVTQRTAAGTKQATGSINHLASLTDELRHSVSTFKLPVTTNGHSHRV
jgi:twitching motility protein PilJ